MKLWQSILASGGGGVSNFVPPSVGLQAKTVMNWGKAEWWLDRLNQIGHDYFKNYLINSFEITVTSGADYFYYMQNMGISQARWLTFRASAEFASFFNYYHTKVKQTHTTYGTPDYAVGYYNLDTDGWGAFNGTDAITTSNAVSQFLATNSVKF